MLKFLVSDQKALPVIEGLKKWLLAAKTSVLPKSLMGKAGTNSSCFAQYFLSLFLDLCLGLQLYRSYKRGKYCLFKEVSCCQGVRKQSLENEDSYNRCKRANWSLPREGINRRRPRNKSIDL